MVLGCAGLTTGLLHALLDVDDFSGYAAGSGWVDQVSGTVEAAVLGICALFLLIPAAFGYLLIMLVREAALLILTATLPIAAAGALGDGTRAWMWKAVRWFLAACLTAPLLALVLGLGVQIARAAFPDARQTEHRCPRRPAHGRGRCSGDTRPTQPARRHPGHRRQRRDGGRGLRHHAGRLLLPDGPVPAARLRRPRHRLGRLLPSAMAANGGVAGLLPAHRPHEPAPGAATQPAADGARPARTPPTPRPPTGSSPSRAHALPAAGTVIGGAMNAHRRPWPSTAPPPAPTSWARQASATPATTTDADPPCEAPTR